MDPDALLNYDYAATERVGARTGRPRHPVQIQFFTIDAEKSGSTIPGDGSYFAASATNVNEGPFGCWNSVFKTSILPRPKSRKAFKISVSLIQAAELKFPPQNPLERSL